MEGGKCPTLCKKGGVWPGGGNVWRGNMSGEGICSGGNCLDPNNTV